MNKLFKMVGVSCLGLLALTSCGNSQDLTTLRKDTVSDTIRSEYNITFDATTGSKKLYTSDRGDNKSYFDVYIAEDYKASLVSYTMTLETLKSDVSDLEKRLEQNKLTSITIGSLSFSTALYTDEASSFLNEIYNSTYGITSKTTTDGTTTNNFDFGFDPDSTASWTRTINGKYVNEAYLDGKTDISIQVTYLPLLLNRYYNGNEIVRLYFFLPIREAALVDGQKIVAPTDGTVKYSLEEYTSIAKAVDFKFTEDKKLLLGE